MNVFVCPNELFSADDIAKLKTKIRSKIVNPADGQCWKWNAGKQDGYGLLAFRFKTYKAHRISYMVHRGQIQEDHVIRHICNDRSCVNPAHLEAIRRKENALLGNSPWAINAKKRFCKKGHAFTPQNTGVGLDGSRFCIVCKAKGKVKLKRNLTHGQLCICGEIAKDVSALADQLLPSGRGNAFSHVVRLLEKLEGHMRTSCASAIDG